MNILDGAEAGIHWEQNIEYVQQCLHISPLCVNGECGFINFNPSPGQGIFHNADGMGAGNGTPTRFDIKRSTALRKKLIALKEY